jgi:hypothetical protein
MLCCCTCALQMHTTKLFSSIYIRAEVYLDTRELAEGGDLVRRVHVGHGVVQQPRAVQVVGVLRGVRTMQMSARVCAHFMSPGW